MSRRTLPTLIAVAALAVPAVLSGQASQRAQQQTQQAQQQEHMQQQMAQRMTEMMQRMDGLRERLHQMDATLQRQMERTQNQQRLQEHQALRDMCGDLGGFAERMKQNAERVREMVQDRLFQDDAEMQRDMDRLREHWEEMGQRLQESVEALERMQKRLGQPPGERS